MKIFKNKKETILFLCLVTAILVGLAIISFKKGSDSYKIISSDFSICTGDVPTSSCGSYEVKVQSMSGKELTLTVPGFDNRKSEKYDEITSKIEKAKQDKTNLKLEVNNKQEIISASKQL